MPIDDLLLAEDLFEELLAGKKEVTLRLGYRDVRLGEFAFKCTGNEDRIVPVGVYMVIHSGLRDVPDDILEAEGFEDTAAAVACLRRFYPDVSEDSEITVVLFEKETTP